MAPYLRMLLRLPIQSDNSFSMIRAAGSQQQACYACGTDAISDQSILRRCLAACEVVYIHAKRFPASLQTSLPAELIAQEGVAAIYENRSQVLAGGLMSYGGDLRENYRQEAMYVDRILKGARPGHLPVIQASRFELILNAVAPKRLD